MDTFLRLYPLRRPGVLLVRHDRHVQEPGKNGRRQLERMLKRMTSNPFKSLLLGAGISAAAIRRIRESLPHARAFHMSGKITVESPMSYRNGGRVHGPAPALTNTHCGAQTRRTSGQRGRN